MFVGTVRVIYLDLSDRPCNFFLPAWHQLATSEKVSKQGKHSNPQPAFRLESREVEEVVDMDSRRLQVKSHSCTVDYKSLDAEISSRRTVMGSAIREFLFFFFS